MTPSFLYRVWRFMEFRDTWEGTATDLIRDMQEIDVKPKSVTSLLSQYCYNFLEPNRILFRTHRTSKCRMIYLSHIPKADANDEDDEDDANDECDE